MILSSGAAPGAGVRGIVSNLRGLGGLGDDACGANPCGIWDYVWSSDACDAYLACENLPPMTFSGQLGVGVKSIASGAADVAGQGTAGLLSNTTTDIMLAVVAGLAVLLLVKGKI